MFLHFVPQNLQTELKDSLTSLMLCKQPFNLENEVACAEVFFCACNLILEMLNLLRPSKDVTSLEPLKQLKQLHILRQVATTL